jgi:hypothetical protein
MESLESILTDLHGKYKDPQAAKPNDAKPSDADQVSASLPSQPAPSSLASNSLDQLLNDLRGSSSSYTPTAIPEVTSKQSIPVISHDLEQVAEQQKVKDQQTIAKQATEWLKQLDPLGGEGLWFEEFAKNYPSRLEAAIALLQSH